MFKPTTFGKFFLYEKLAIGGMAEIFKAKLYGIAGFEKTLVVKQILPEYANDHEFVKMFIDEANIAVSLTHGNIVPVYELGKIADRYYIAMEYVDGENLETVVDQCAKLQRDIPVNLCVEIAIEVCKGLDYAHRKTGPDGVSLGIVHRDVSPQNVMLSFDGEVKIVDFGIAKAASKLSLTRVGTLKGKFGYMSPEQAMGHEVDRRTDVYAAGIVLYEILTGRKLFDAENDLELLKKVRAGVVAPPSSLHPGIPAELDRLVLKALAKDINARYQYASEFQGDLQRWLYSRPAATGEETISSFMKLLFRRDAGRAAGAVPPAPVPAAPPVDDPAFRAERSRRDVSYAQSPSIAKFLEDAGREARRVMGDEISEDHTVSAEAGAEDSGSFGAAVALRDEDRPTVPPESALFADDRPTTSTNDGDDFVEFDETTGDLNRRLLESTSTVEKPNVEGPIVRIPRKSARNPLPPWQTGPIPAAVGEEERTQQAARGVSVASPAAPARSGAKPGSKAGARARDTGANGVAVSVSVEEPPLLHASVTRPAVFRRARYALYLSLALGGLAVVGVGVKKHLEEKRHAGTGPIAGSSIPIPTPTPRSVPSSVASPVTTAVAKETAAPPPATHAPTPAATPATRRASIETTPSGVAVYLGSRRLGVTPLTTSVSSADVTLRFAKSGYHDLRKSYPAANGTLRISEKLDAIPRAAPVEFGTVSVNATPWGRVKIDGVFVKNTPLIKHRLRAGSHEIEVANPDFPKKTQKRTITVHANVDEDPIIVSFE